MVQTNFEILDVTKLVEREGFDCKECGHRHSGKTLAYICVGCPCDFVPDFNAIQARTDQGGKVELAEIAVAAALLLAIALWLWQAYRG